MFCKCFEKCYVVLIFAVAVCAQMDMHLTPEQKSRIDYNYYKENLNKQTAFDKRSRYLYNIIHSRPENLDIAIGNECKIKPMTIPDFSALNEHGLGISDIKCLEHLWKIRYYEEIHIAKATCAVDDASDYDKIENTANLHFPDDQYSEHAHMGAIGWQKSKETWLFVCEGALISERHMLTSASCTRLPERYAKEVFDLKPKVVRFGVYDISDKEEFGKSPMDVLISEITLHPRYKPDLHLYYDAAIIEIDKSLIFSSIIHPACIWTNTTSLTDIGLLTGWYDVISNKTVKTKKFIRANSFDVFDMIEFINKPKPEEVKHNVSVNKNMMQLNKAKFIPDISCDMLLRNKRVKNWYGLLYHQQCGFSSCYEKNCELEGTRGTVLQARIRIPEITEWTMHYVLGVRSGEFTSDSKNMLSVYTKASVLTDWIKKIVWPEAIITINN